MTYRIRIAPAAARQLRKLEIAARRRVQAALRATGRPAPASGVRRMVGGEGEWWARTGGFRVVYEIHDDLLLVIVVAVGHHRDIYQHR